VVSPTETAPISLPENAVQPPSTAGMTTKVVKGSLWTLAGQVAPLAVSLFTTPFVIRMLGAEGYGVLILVGLIPTYLGFADFGMSIASTKFASEAYAEGDTEKEARIVHTAALIAFCASLPFGIAIFALSGWLATLFNVPEHLMGEASLALKIASVTFIINFLNGIFNTPQLTRLRMDLNTFVTSGFRILGIIAVPIVLYLGFGIVGAVFVLMVASVLTLVGHLVISGRLDKHLFEFAIDRSVARPLLNFGSALAISGIAGVLLVNLEKAVLAKNVSVEALAYYSVAFTLATMTTMFSTSMTQSLIPAFSQLLGPTDRERLNNLFLRSLRMNFLLILPLLAALFAFARPLFTLWAGESFGEYSTHPFYVLMAGLLINLLAHIPYSLLMASGRTDLFAKVYWIELLPYIGLLTVLTLSLGPVGAALAWTIRTAVDSLILSLLLKRVAGIRFNFFGTKWKDFLVATLVLFTPVAITIIFDGHGYWPMVSAIIFIPIYLVLTTKLLLDADERRWILERFRYVFNLPINSFQV
jgi:O-antigen/teichoic acid export membrane protein